MNEIIAAIVGAVFSMLLMTISNISSRRERDIREIFSRLNKLEQSVAAIANPREGFRNWRKS
tara:strand:- start:2441 stop:2626 length:186 start_codon:yes stop_codon:yes gene_type:complete